VVDAVAVMHAHHIAHFDLKCSNVLLESLPGQAGSGLGQLAPGAQQAPFRAVLGDFGQAAILAGRWVGWGLWWVPPWPPGPVGHC
jgi:serine/threonine protein kinase